MDTADEELSLLGPCNITCAHFHTMRLSAYERVNE